MPAMTTQAKWGMEYQIDPILDVEDISAKSMQAEDQARCIQATSAIMRDVKRLISARKEALISLFTVPCDMWT